MNLCSVHSTELEKRQKQSQQISDKVSTLHKEVIEIKKFVETRKEMSHLNDQLEKQMELLKPDFKEELSLKQDILDAAVGRPLSESEKWHKESQEQLETPQTEIVERDKERQLKQEMKWSWVWMRWMWLMIRQI